MINSILFGGLLSLLTHFFAIRNGFFIHLKFKGSNTIAWRHVLLIFALYLFISLILSPFLFQIAFFIFKPIVQLPEITKITLFQTGTFALIFLAFFLFGYFDKTFYLKSIWKDKSYPLNKPYLWDISLGVLAFVIAFPLILLCNQLIEWMIQVFFKKEIVEQVAVTYLKKSIISPFAFALSFVNILIFAPTMEEFLFRGCLQSYLRTRLGSYGAIFLTAIIFGLIHFSKEQKYSNFSIISTLFLFSLYLGYLYERQRSLISPIVLHMTFNAFSVIRIFYVAAFV